MKHHNIDQFFTVKMFRRQYYPALISAIVLSFGDIADGLVLGNSIGFIGLAAIGLTLPAILIFYVISEGFGIGGSVRFSRQMAQGRREEALAEFQGQVFITLLVGVILAVVGNIFIVPILSLLGANAEQDAELFDTSRVYLRLMLAGAPFFFLNFVLNYYMKNDDLEKQASIAFIVGNVVDVVMNILLVLVCRLGVLGAGIATITGYGTGMILSVIFIVRRRKRCVLRFLPFRPVFRHVAPSFGKGFFSSIESLFNMMFVIIANHLLLRTLGSIGVAVFDIILSISYFVINISEAASKSSLPVVGTYCGERNETGTRLALKTAMFFAMITSLILGGTVILFPEPICRFFGMEASEIPDIAAGALRLYACSIPFEAACILLAGFYEARAQERDTLVIMTLRGVFPILLALFFSFVAPDLFFLLYVIAGAGALIVFGIYKRITFRSPFDRERIYRKTIYSTCTEISETTAEIEQFCEERGVPAKQQYIAQMALEEICVAMLEGGFRGKKDGFIQITMVILQDKSVELHIRDNAASFNPLAMSASKKLSDDEANINAISIAAIKKKAQAFSYRHYQGFNTIIIRI